MYLTPSYHRPASRPPHRRVGFTLVEMLVVIALIGLLIGLLLPAISLIRAQAGATQCLSNLRQFNDALLLYTSEFRGYMPGMNTSGADLANGDVTTLSDPFFQSRVAPVQSDDWVSPTMGETLGFPKDPTERLAWILGRDEYACPLNERRYDQSQAGGTYNLGNSDYQAFSYAMSTMWQMRSSPESGNDAYDGSNSDIMSGPTAAFQTNSYPRRFRFRLSDVEATGKKVSLYEGSRRVIGDDRMEVATELHNDDGHGTNFSNSQWVYYNGNAGSVNTVANGLRWDNTNTTGFNLITLRTTMRPITRDLTFRHADESTNMAYFDGSVKVEPLEESVLIEKHAPTGLVIPAQSNAGLTVDPQDETDGGSFPMSVQ